MNYQLINISPQTLNIISSFENFKKWHLLAYTQTLTLLHYIFKSLMGRTRGGCREIFCPRSCRLSFGPYSGTYKEWTHSLTEVKHAMLR
jgi:hypothetical protein